MSDTNTPLPFEGDPVVESLGMGGGAGNPLDPGGDAIDIGEDTEIDAAGDGAEDVGERTADEGRIPVSGNDEPTDPAPATQDSAAAETNGMP
ncbi:hypothetical protein ELQ90_05265 [Labedella phragmitis]|uniref:Uncharacterized protein n=1 Tax=Labedella phragmitis TaxID=2498849 RepID=A0A444PUI6_9MICO|nr:hypothetical protein [Labedella phragmitis]RWZ51522.1 hypothetical protein ELQ90_05265 [Labedella phragmitis]